MYTMLGVTRVVRDLMILMLLKWPIGMQPLLFEQASYLLGERRVIAVVSVLLRMRAVKEKGLGSGLHQDGVAMRSTPDVEQRYIELGCLSQGHPSPPAQSE